ncbi:MAG TPA: cyclopropane-fatty-acyl-phospholipid synthase family protein [Desulfotignum sp.]|nr:cyclopropane-fatty-acyl-phospholipid synthase family protein [Desulfotignum sp.]
MKSITSPGQVPQPRTLFTARSGPWARRMVLNLMNHLSYGRLIIRENDRTLAFGPGNGPEAVIQVHDTAFFTRVITDGSIGAAESYVEGHWDTDDLTAVIRIIVGNQPVLDRMDNRLAKLVKPLLRLAHLRRQNSKKGARQNILAHYDLGNDMYQAFLDPAMMYSAAIFPHDTSSLEAAAVHKLDVICQQLHLGPEDRVVEIGAGWGGFAIHAASRYGCHVTTTTISDAQYDEARHRISALGLQDRITLLKTDYRELTGQFDKLVSIEMIEAVGHRYLPAFMKTCESLLKPDGIMLIQAITIKDQLYHSYLKSVDFIQRHIFPGGCLPATHHLLRVLTDHTGMVVRKLTDFGFDYAKTLSHWRKRFDASRNALESLGYDRRFRRLWKFYLCYCEGGFLERSISVIHLVATMPGNRTRI